MRTGTLSRAVTAASLWAQTSRCRLVPGGRARSSDKTWFFASGPQSYMTQSLLDCSTGRLHQSPWTEDCEYGVGFIWLRITPMPHLSLLAVFGCVWGAPYLTEFFDFRDPVKGWPEVEAELGFDGRATDFYQVMDDSFFSEAIALRQTPLTENTLRLETDKAEYHFVWDRERNLLIPAENQDRVRQRFPSLRGGGASARWSRSRRKLAVVLSRER